MTVSPSKSKSSRSTAKSGVPALGQKHLRENEIKAAELQAAAREQERISSELHDGLGQHLTGIAFLCKALSNNLHSRHAAEAADADQIVNLVNQAVANTRAMAKGLQPVGPEDNALSVALSNLAKNVSKMYGIECIFSTDDFVPVSQRDVAHHLYRIAQEAVNNAIKHGAANRIVIELGQTSRTVVLSVTNNGKPIQPETANIGLGLHSMHYRARVMHAKLSLEKVGEQGVRLRVVVARKLAQCIQNGSQENLQVDALG